MAHREKAECRRVRTLLCVAVVLFFSRPHGPNRSLSLDESAQHVNKERSKLSRLCYQNLNVTEDAQKPGHKRQFRDESIREITKVIFGDALAIKLKPPFSRLSSK